MNRTSLKKAVLPTIVVTMIFFLNYFCFGKENTIIGPFLTLSFLKFKEMDDYRGCMLRTLGIYCAMALIAWASLLHPALNLACNGLALFWTGYFLIDEYNPLNYFPAGMALIFFQISPVSLARLPIRLLALAVSFFLVFLFLYAIKLARRGRPGQVKRLAQEGFGLCRRLLLLLAEDGGKEAENRAVTPGCRESVGSPAEAELVQKELCHVCRRLSLGIYQANRSSLKKTVPQNAYCGCIACFQMVIYLSRRILSGQAGEGTQQREQMEKLLEEFAAFREEGILGKETASREEGISGKETVSWKEGIPGKEADLPGRLRFRENPMDLRSFRLRFALRQTVVMTPCLLLGYLGLWDNSYWLAISVFFMMVPVYENTAGRVAQRIWGSVLGIGICLIAFAVFRGFWPRVLLMTVANFFIYASGSYASMVMCITCSALALNFGSDSYVEMLLQRLIYTLSGAVIALAANLWVFKIRAWRQCQYVMELLDGLKEDLKKAQGLPAPERILETNRIVVKSYLLSSRMEEFNQTAAAERRREDVEQFILDHMQQVARQMLENYWSEGGGRNAGGAA